MGSSPSKAARGATRQFPNRAPGAAVPRSAAPKPKPEAKPRAADGAEDDAVRADAADSEFVTGDFSKRLKQMGIAEPNPTYSPSSTATPGSIDVDGPSQPLGPAYPAARSNTTLSVLEARRQLQQQADEDLEAAGRSGSQGRRFADMRTMVQAMQMRSRGAPTADIEKRFGLQPNLLERLGRPSVLSHVTAGTS